MSNFDFQKAIRILEWQVKHNQWFGRFAQALNFQLNPKKSAYWEWPYISVDAFKKIDGFYCDHEINKPDAIFMSSGTANNADRAKHYVLDLKVYKEYALAAFYQKYPKSSYAVFAFLPAYSDNPNSSLVQMLQFIIEEDESGLSGFLDLENPQIPQKIMGKVSSQNKRIILFGAAFGLVDIAEKGQFRLPKTSLIIETGGMKTHRKEMSRTQIKEVLASGFGIPITNIHSEYGMCELLSQAYEHGDGWYECPPWMKIFARPINQPFAEPLINEIGQLYVIDLANEHSCAFLQLNDQGIVNEEGKFQVLGRIPHAALRGCNYLLEQN